MPSARDIIAELPELQWRNLRAPCEDVSFHLSHSQAERRYPYIDGAGHDWTGRDPITCTVRLHFINTIESGLFPGRLQRWFEAVADGSSGDLDHPVLGRIRARVLEGDFEVTAKSRAGIVVTVKFTETLDNPEEATKFTLVEVDPVAAAKATDAAMSAAGIDYPDGKGSNSFLDAINQVTGAVFSASNSLTGAVNQVIGTIDGIYSDIEAIGDHSLWAAKTNLTQLHAAMKSLEKKAGKGARPTATKTIAVASTLDAIAASVGNTTEEVMSLNLPLLKTPKVPANATVKYFTG